MTYGTIKRTGFTTHLRNAHHTALPFSDSIPDMNDLNNYCVTHNRTFSTKSSYMLHLPHVHLDKIPELYQEIDCKNSPVKQSRYWAEWKKVFPSKRVHRLHISKIHGVDPFKICQNIDRPDISKPNNRCTLCDRTYYYRHSYCCHSVNVHNFLMPSKSLTRRIVVRSCKAPIVDPLNKHCNVCDRLYASPKSYREHMAKYHHIKSFVTGVFSRLMLKNQLLTK